MHKDVQSVPLCVRDVDVIYVKLRGGLFDDEVMMLQAIIGFHQDEQEDWVAKLACKHTQHVRHNPPWTNRPWVTTHEGRDRMIGHCLNCKLCDVACENQSDEQHDKKSG